MRTTLTLEPDVAKEVERRRRQHDRSLKEEVNRLLRLALLHDREPSYKPGPAYRTEPVSTGRCLVASLDDVVEAVEQAEGAGFR